MNDFLSTLLGSIGNLFQPAVNSVSNALQQFFPNPSQSPTPRPGYQFIPGTQIQVPIGSEFLPKQKRNQIIATPALSASPSPFPTQRSGDRIRKGLINYGGQNLPALNYVPLFEKAMEMYPLFQQNPYLLPQISILESSGGRNITRANNPLNWGAKVQAEGLFSPASEEEAIMKAITGIGERMSAYAPFRVNRPLTPEEILQFAQVYEPANQSYGQNLLEGIKRFELLGGGL